MPNITIAFIGIYYGVLPRNIVLAKKNNNYGLDLQNVEIAHSSCDHDQATGVRRHEVNGNTRMKISTELCASLCNSGIIVLLTKKIGASLIPAGAVEHEQAFNRFGCCVSE